jgi:hypothetical protein
MFEHVHRIVIVGSVTHEDRDSSDSLIARLRPTGLDRYTGLIAITPDVRLAVLEGPTALNMLHRHAMSLAGLSAAQTLLNQRTTFRWFSTLMLQHHDAAPSGFSMEELSALATSPPRTLCNHITALALLGNHHLPPATGTAASTTARMVAIN